MKKVLIVVIIAIAAGVVGFFLLSEYFTKSTIETRCAELGGLVSRTGEAVRTALEREWWHSQMPGDEYDFPDAEQNSDSPPMGRREWYEEWLRENGAHDGIVTRNLESCEFLEEIKDGPAKGGRRVRWTWHVGVVNGAYGNRAVYEGIWAHDNQFWRLYRLKLISRTETTAPTHD